MTLYSTTPEERIKELYGELSELRAQLAQAQAEVARLQAQLAAAGARCGSLCRKVNIGQSWR